MAMPYSAHCVWVHEIDSKGRQPADEGDMFLLPNGDCMEVGVMRDATNKSVEIYKEYWTGPDVVPGSGGLRKSPCVVARTVLPPTEVQDRALDVSGVLIRVGDYCQGILRHVQKEKGKYEVWVERWVKRSPEPNPALPAGEYPEGPETEWVKDERSNTPSGEEAEAFIPCMWACTENRKLGEEIVDGGVTWRVTEIVS